MRTRTQVKASGAALVMCFFLMFICMYKVGA
jgi:hypothetical protein